MHGTLGPGFIHYIYRRASQIELQLRRIPVQRKQEITISFRGKVLETVPCRLLVVGDKVAVAAVAFREITEVHRQRMRWYLKLLNLRLGMIRGAGVEGLEPAFELLEGYVGEGTGS